jgi:hypothetical protein
MTSAYLPFQRGVHRCSDCFDRLYLKEDSTYETPKIKQFDIQSTKDTVTPTEVSLSLNTHGLEELNTNVKKDILQTNVNGNSKDEIYSAKPTNICLMNYFNQSIDETTQPDDNNEDSEVAIKWKIRRVTKRRENEEQLSISDDLKLYNILYKRDVYGPNIRVVSPKVKSILNSMFKTPRSITKNVKSTEILITNEQNNECSTVIIDTEKLTLSSTADDGTPPISNDGQNDIDSVSEFENGCYILREKESSQNVIWTPEDKIEDPKYLKDLSVVSVIKFCSNYCRYVPSVSEPVKIQNYIDDNVKTMFVKTKTAKQWKVLKVVDFNNLSSNDIILLLQDYCTPKSRKDFYTNLKASTTCPSTKLVFDIGMSNFELFHKNFNVYIKTFKYAYAFLLDYMASKHEIPYTSVRSKDMMTLSYLFLSRLPRSLIDCIYGKTRKRLSRFKSIESLIRSTEKTVHILYKQYCKSYGVNSMT